MDKLSQHKCVGLLFSIISIAVFEVAQLGSYQLEAILGINKKNASISEDCVGNALKGEKRYLKRINEKCSIEQVLGTISLRHPRRDSIYVWLGSLFPLCPPNHHHKQQDNSSSSTTIETTTQTVGRWLSKKKPIINQKTFYFGDQTGFCDCLSRITDRGRQFGGKLIRLSLGTTREQHNWPFGASHYSAVTLSIVCHC